jgi:hypothetical protein
MRRLVMRARIWLTHVICQLEELMYQIVRPAPYLAVALVLAACATGSTSPAAVAPAETTPSPVASAVATAQASPTPSATPTPSASPTAFTSKTYGYSLTVPAGWTIIQATAAWDGKGAPFHDVPQADQFVSPGSASAWFFGAPTTKDLAARLKESIAANATEHGNTCPPVPAFQDPIEIGGESGVLFGYDCGILINGALAVHNGVAYQFGFRDPAVHAAADPADQATFLGLLESVKFPD